MKVQRTLAKYFSLLAAVAFVLASTCWAADDDKKDDSDIHQRIEKSAQVLDEIMERLTRRFLTKSCLIRSVLQ